MNKHSSAFRHSGKAPRKFPVPDEAVGCIRASNGNAALLTGETASREGHTTFSCSVKGWGPGAASHTLASGTKRKRLWTWLYHLQLILQPAPWKITHFRMQLHPRGRWVMFAGCGDVSPLLTPVCIREELSLS